MPFCSSDNKLAGYDEMETDVQDESLDGTTISYSIHLNRPCATCGTEAASADLELTLEIEHDCEQPDADDEGNWQQDGIVWRVMGADGTFSTRAEALEAAEGDAGLLSAEWDDNQEPEFSLDSSDVEATDEMQRTDRHGKPIKNYRYMPRLLGAQVTAHVTCSRCGEAFDVDGSDHLRASEFEVMSH